MPRNQRFRGIVRMARFMVVVTWMVFVIALLAVSYHVAFGAQHRNTSAKNAFKREHPCPSNGNTKGACPGYVIDHIVPLACGGPDNQINMQWQTVSDGKIKDKFELGMCGK